MRIEKHKLENCNSLVGVLDEIYFGFLHWVMFFVFISLESIFLFQTIKISSEYEDYLLDTMYL